MADDRKAHALLLSAWTCGDVTMAQDRLSSLCFEMPSAAIDFGKAAYFGSPSQIARALEVLAEQWAV
jgi:chemotaxis response regulator CheB